MRRTHPDAVRPFRAPLGPVVPVLGIVTCMILMFSLAPENWIRLFVWLAVGMVIYFAYSRGHSHLGRGVVEVHEPEYAEIEPDIPGVSDRGRP
jgi:APA family basic amino acid/polyamine antiporter